MDAYCLDRLATRSRCMLVIGSSTPSLLAWAPNLYATTRSLTSETRLSYQSQTISVLTIAIGCLTPRSNARPFCIKLLVVAPKSNQTTLLPPFSYPSSSSLALATYHRFGFRPMLGPSPTLKPPILRIKLDTTFTHSIQNWPHRSALSTSLALDLPLFHPLRCFCSCYTLLNLEVCVLLLFFLWSAMQAAASQQTVSWMGWITRMLFLVLPPLGSFQFFLRGEQGRIHRPQGPLPP